MGSIMIPIPVASHNKIEFHMTSKGENKIKYLTLKGFTRYFSQVIGVSAYDW